MNELEFRKLRKAFSKMQDRVKVKMVTSGINESEKTIVYHMSDGCKIHITDVPKNEVLMCRVFIYDVDGEVAAPEVDPTMGTITEVTCALAYEVARMAPILESIEILYNLNLRQMVLDSSCETSRIW